MLMDGGDLTMSIVVGPTIDLIGVGISLVDQSGPSHYRESVGPPTLSSSTTPIVSIP